MEVRKIIERAAEPGAHYDPEQMNILADAFDKAWVRIQQDIQGNSDSIENARTKLAKVVLSVAKHSAEPPLMQADAMAEKALTAMFSDPIQL